MTLNLYSTSQAAEYLGIPQRTFQYHIYTAGHIVPDFNNGRALLFTKETLDKFRDEYRSDEGMTIKEAARYLDMSVSGVRHHTFVSGRLVPDAKRGRQVVFHKKTLDAFLRHQHEPAPRERVPE